MIRNNIFFNIYYYIQHIQLDVVNNVFVLMTLITKRDQRFEINFNKILFMFIILIQNLCWFIKITSMEYIFERLYKLL